MTYKEQLLHPNWQRKRMEILSRDEYTCTYCGDTESTLHVHHRIYIKGRKVWEYDDDQLETLCHKCHGDGHELRKLLDRMLAAPGVNLSEVVGLVGGYLDGSTLIDSAMADEASRCGYSYDEGIMASIAGRTWNTLSKVVPLLKRSYSPAQQIAIRRWNGKDSPA